MTLGKRISETIGISSGAFKRGAKTRPAAGARAWGLFLAGGQGEGVEAGSYFIFLHREPSTIVRQIPFQRGLYGDLAEIISARRRTDGCGTLVRSQGLYLRIGRLELGGPVDLRSWDMEGGGRGSAKQSESLFDPRSVFVRRVGRR